MRSNSRKRKGTGFGLIALMVLCLCGIISYKMVDLKQQRRNVDKEVEALNQQLEDEQQRQSDIEDEKVYRQTKKYVEDVAREQLGLVYEDEIIFKPEDESNNK